MRRVLMHKCQRIFNKNQSSILNKRKCLTSRKMIKYRKWMSEDNQKCVSKRKMMTHTAMTKEILSD